jgi:hypothetical protein
MRNKAVMFSALLASALSASVGCQKPIKLQRHVSNKVWLRVKPGTVINWIDYSGSPLPVTFLSSPPCQENPAGGTCTITRTPGNYTYECPECEDPVIVVESDIGPLEAKVNLTSATATTTIGVPIFCKPGTNYVTVKPDPVPAKKGGSIAWYDDGAVRAWTVTLDMGVCTNGKEFGPGNQRCHLSDSLISGRTYPYKVNAAACTGKPDGDASIKIE